MIDKDAIFNALGRVRDVTGGNIVGNARVTGVSVDGGKVRINLSLPEVGRDEKYRIEDECFDAAMSVEGVEDVAVVVSTREQTPGPTQATSPTENPFDQQAAIPGVKTIIAVASGKGGVGKSTVCVNLALALARSGAHVGLLDADVYGPSLQILLGVRDRPRAGREKEVRPVEKNGLKLMSLGFLTDASTPVIWRGPIVMGVVKKFLQDVEWGELDFLMVDLPPGTGDAQLTLAQTVPIDGVIIVTTPSELALIDAEKGLRMFKQVNAPVIGVVENMSTFVCPHCGETTDIFASGGADKLSRNTSVEILGKIPLDSRVRSGGDDGHPIVEQEPDSPIGRAFLDIAGEILRRFPSEVR